MNGKLIGIALFLSGLSSCTLHRPGAGDYVTRAIVDPSEEYQTVESFGASDCWSVQFVGENWPVCKRDSIADLLFSLDFDGNGNPKGIGLSLWRFNIGGGTAEQGAESGIPNAWRRAECFLTGKGSYDWNKQAGQQWFIKAAKQRGVGKLLAFTNTAPVFFTKNGKGWSPGGSAYNIKPEKMDDYADFLADVCGHFNGEGIVFDYISPFNEPQWNWAAPATQEGSPARNGEIARVVRSLSPKLTARGLKTEIAIPETAQLQYLYAHRDTAGRDNQLYAFFNPASPHYVGDIANAKKAVMGHSYFTTSELNTLISVRKTLKDSLDNYKGMISYWQSEFCILEDHPDLGGGGNRRDLGMATALYVARVIHYDLSVANAASWSWWTALSAVDYKDGLVYLDRGDNGLRGAGDPGSGLLQQDGFFRDSKLLWAMGNYSRFIRPGMVRIDVRLDRTSSVEARATDLMLTGYKTEDNTMFVFVGINYSDNEQILSFADFCGEQHIHDGTFECYTTSESQNLQRSHVDGTRVAVGPKSVVTLVGRKAVE
ncbi:MAG: glycoside hydrolase [Breznakibacter sp.]